MNHSKRPLWKKSILQTLNLADVLDYINEIAENGDMFGYARDGDYGTGEDGYYQEYKEQFDMH